MTEERQLMEVILYVEDMAAQVHFYRDIMGLRVRQSEAAQDLTQSYWIELETGPCTLALHGGGRGRLGADAPKVVFSVRDVAAVRDDLHLKGVPMDAIRSPAPGIQVCDGTDPEGNRFSIESRDPLPV